MIYILFFIIVVMFVGSFFLFQKEILSPTVVACGVFLVSVLFACLYAGKWEAHISAITVLVIVTALSTFALGEFLARKLLFKKKNSERVNLPLKPIDTPLWALVVVVLAGCVILAVDVIHVFSLAKMMGYRSGAEYSIMYYVREAGLSHMANLSPYYRIIIHGSHLMISMAYIFCFIFIYNAVFFGKYGRNLLNIIPILIALVLTVLSGGRTGMIHIAEIILIITVLFFMQKTNWSSTGFKQVSRWAWVGFITFYMLFIFAGSLKSKTFSQKPIDAIAFYTGLSIALLDDYLEHPRLDNNFFGEETLNSFYGIAKKAGADIPDEYTQYKHLEFVGFKGVAGNVYTAIRRLLQDYGWAGMYSLMFFFGLFYSVFFLLIKNKQNCAVIVYAYMFYAVTMMSIDEQFFNTVFSFVFLERMFFLIVLYELLVSKTLMKRLRGGVIKNS